MVSSKDVTCAVRTCTCFLVDLELLLRGLWHIGPKYPLSCTAGRWFKIALGVGAFGLQNRLLEVLPIHSHSPPSQHGFATPYFWAKSSIVPIALSCSSCKIRWDIVTTTLYHQWLVDYAQFASTSRRMFVCFVKKCNSWFSCHPCWWFLLYLHDDLGALGKWQRGKCNFRQLLQLQHNFNDANHVL